MEAKTQKMFEIMQKLNPDFKLSEANFGTFNTQPVAQQQPQATTLKGDNKTYDKAVQVNKSLSNKSAKVNTTTEFPEAFKTWFAKLGYTPEKGNINISRVLSNVKKAMIELGYK